MGRNLRGGRTSRSGWPVLGAVAGLLRGRPRVVTTSRAGRPLDSTRLPSHGDGFLTRMLDGPPAHPQPQTTEHPHRAPTTAYARPRPDYPPYRSVNPSPDARVAETPHLREAPPSGARGPSDTAEGVRSYASSSQAPHALAMPRPAATAYPYESAPPRPYAGGAIPPTPVRSRGPLARWFRRRTAVPLDVLSSGQPPAPSSPGQHPALDAPTPSVDPPGAAQPGGSIRAPELEPGWWRLDAGEPAAIPPDLLRPRTPRWLRRLRVWSRDTSRVPFARQLAGAAVLAALALGAASLPGNMGHTAAAGVGWALRRDYNPVSVARRILDNEPGFRNWLKVQGITLPPALQSNSAQPVTAAAAASTAANTCTTANAECNPGAATRAGSAPNGGSATNGGGSASGAGPASTAKGNGHTPILTAMGPLTPPLQAPVAVPFGTPVPVPSTDGRTQPRMEPTQGVLFWATASAQVHAIAAGQVLAATYTPSLGQYVLVNHVDGWSSLYAHCAKLLVKSGARIARGQTVCTTGRVGSTFGPYLYFELRQHGKPVDPVPYLGLHAGTAP